MAARALRQREREIVTMLAPKVRVICLDMLGNTNAFDVEPTTLEELARPLAKIMQSVGEDKQMDTSR
jgi:hypothetical protein